MPRLSRQDAGRKLRTTQSTPWHDVLAQREADFPITKAIYVLFERIGDGRYVACAMGVWAMALLAATLVGASILLGRRMGAMFRV